MEVNNQDTPMQEGAEEGKGGKLQALDHFLVPIDILLATKTAQNQNGLKQDDYYRYSKYCSRKIHRVRKATKFTQGQRRYVKNDIKLEDLEKVKKNQRSLQIPLFQSERDWSQATFLRKQLTEGGEDFIRNKYGARKRFRRALQYANQLYDIIKECGYDSQTCLEAEAYKAFIKSALDIEFGRFQEALDELVKVNIIYSRLSKNKDLLEALIYQEKIDQIQPLIRLCTYNTGQGGVDVSKLEEEYDKKHQIHERISQNTIDTRKVGDEKIEEITYQGKSISLKTEKLKNCFHKLELQLNALQSTENGGDAVTLTEKVKAHTDWLNAIEECIIIIQKEKTEEAKRNEASGALYNILLAYVNEIKQTSILERCLLKAFSIAEELPIAQVFTKQKLKGNHRPQNIIKLLDKGVRALKTIAQDKSFIDPAKLAEYELRDMVINIYLKFYIAVNYANDKNYEATYAIMLRVKEDFQRCLDFYSRAKLLETSKGHKEVTDLQKFSGKDIEYMLCKTKAALMFEHQHKLDSLNQDFDKMEVKEQTLKQDSDSIDIVKWLFNSQGKLRGNKQTLGDRQVEFSDSNLNILETGGKNAMIIDNSEGSSYDELLHKKAKLNKKSVLVELYPKFQPVMPKPFFFDVAGEAIEFPDLEQQIKQLEEKETKGSGLFGRIKGAFFG